MGICIDVLIVDWDHLMSVPEDQRYAELYEAADSVDEERRDAGRDQPPSTGPQWFWPSPPTVGWFGKFDLGARPVPAAELRSSAKGAVGVFLRAYGGAPGG